MRPRCSETEGLEFVAHGGRLSRFKEGSQGVVFQLLKGSWFALWFHPIPTPEKSVKKNTKSGRPLCSVSGVSLPFPGVGGRVSVEFGWVHFVPPEVQGSSWRLFSRVASPWKLFG